MFVCVVERVNVVRVGVRDIRQGGQGSVWAVKLMNDGLDWTTNTRMNKREFVF